MPFAAPRLCLTAACRELVRGSDRRCPTHERARHAQDRAERGSAHERGYGSRWQKTRALFLQANPLCVQCEGYGVLAPADVVDHVTPHRGDDALFWDEENWQPLCAKCHNRKTAMEDGGFGAAAILPPGMRRSLVPLIVVAGAPGSGKTTMVQRHAAAGDLVLDMDVLRARLTGLPMYESPESTFVPALRERNAQIMRLTTNPVPWPRAWLIATAPTAAARRWWRRKADARIVLVETPTSECAERITKDHRRRDKARFHAAAEQWWKAYQRDPADEVWREGWAP